MRNVILFLFVLIISKVSVAQNDKESQTNYEQTQDSISITYIANAGFLVEMNDKKIAFDAFFKESFGKYDCPDSK